jgi:hypothetical protein
MDEQTKQLLNSRNPDDRKKAIRIMAQSKDESALPYLAALYKTETDPEIKDLVVQAGRYIRKQLEATQSDNVMPNSANMDDMPKPKRERVDVSEANEKKAHALLDRAMSFIGAREADAEKQAQDLVRKAYALNPNIRFDPYYKGIVGQAFSMDAEDVLDALDRGAGMGDEKAKRKRGDNANHEATWGDALGAYTLYGIVIGAVVVLSMVLAIVFLRAPIESYLQEITALQNRYGELGATTAVNTQAVGQIFSALTGAGAVIGIIYGVFTAIVSVVTLFIYHLSLHFVAKWLLGGDGTLPNLIYKTTLFITVVTVIGGILGIVINAVTFQQIVSLTMTYDSVEALESLPAQLSTLDTILSVLSLVSFAFSFFILFRMCQLIGEVYQFGTGRGCVTIILNTILWVVFACGLSFLLVQSLVNGLNGTMNLFITLTPR